MHIGHLAALLLAATLGGCSFKTTLDKMVSRERQAELVDTGKAICTTPTEVSPLLHSDIASSLAQAVPLLPRECPVGGAEWQLASYNWSTNVTNGVTERQEEAVVIGTAASKWTTVELRFYRRGEGPLQITAWNVLGSTTRPAALNYIDTLDNAASTARWALPVGGLAATALIVWLVRRRRRHRAA